MRRIGGLALLWAGAAFTGRAFAEERAATLTLEQVVGRALAHHPRLSREQAALDAARARAKQAFAGYLPGLTGEFTYAPQTPNYVPLPAFKRVIDARAPSGIDTVTDTAGNNVTAQCVPPTSASGGLDHSVCRSAPETSPRPSYALSSYWTASIGIHWTLFDWGKTYYAERAARTAVDAGNMTVAAARAQIELDAKLAFFDELAAEQVVKVAEEEVESGKRHLETAQALHDAGRNTRIDVAHAEAVLAASELALVRARSAVDLTRAVLAASMGEDAVQNYSLLEPASEGGGAVPPKAELAAAAARRPEVRELTLEAAAASDEGQSARAAYLPALELRAGPFWAGRSLDELVTNYGATISLVYPSTGMNPWLVGAQREEAAARSAEFASDARTTHNAVRLEAEQARSDWIAAHQAKEASATLLNAARERREQAEMRYHDGVGTFLELSDAEVDYANARLESVRATYDIGRARARVDRSLGR